MFGQAGHSAKCLSTFVAFDLHPAICMHSLMSAQIGELSIALETNLTSEWFDRAVDMGVLFQARTGCKSLATFRASMASGSDMVGPDVSLEIAWISENFLTILTWKPPEFSMYHFVSEQVWSPSKAFVAMLTLILARFVTVILNHVIVQSGKGVTNEVISLYFSLVIASFIAGLFWFLGGWRQKKQQNFNNTHSSDFHTSSAVIYNHWYPW